jgi:hypothetical protein
MQGIVFSQGGNDTLDGFEVGPHAREHGLGFGVRMTT